MKILKLLPLLFIAGCTGTDPVQDKGDDIPVVVPEIPVIMELPPETARPAPIALPIIAPQPQPILIQEIFVMAPVNPMVFYTVNEVWTVPEGTRRPVPELVIQARLSFDVTGADDYAVIRNEAVVTRLSETSEPYTFQFKQPGLQNDLDVGAFPVIQIRAQTQDVIDLSPVAEWVAE